MKKTATKGLDALMQAPKATTAQPRTASTLPTEKPYKSACYQMPREIDEQIHKVAALERRKVGATVAQALKLYIDNFRRENPEADI